MSNVANETLLREVTFLVALNEAEADIDTSEIPEIEDWSGASVGKFYRASVKKPSRREFLSGLKRFFGLSESRRNDQLRVTAQGDSPGKEELLSGVLATGGMYSRMSEPQLVTECALGVTEEAWSEFVRRFNPLIAGVIEKEARRFGKASPTLIDDLVQDVYLRLCANEFRALRQLNVLNEHLLFGFLKRIASMVTVDHFRRSVAARGATRPLEQLGAAEPIGRSGVFERERNILLEKVDRYLKTLSHESNFQRDYEIFWLYYRKGLTAKEISMQPTVKLTT